MKDIEALITLARTYCQEHYAYWSDRYAKERTGTDFPYTYSDSDYNLFPRYNVLSAIQAEVETLVGQECTYLSDCKKELKQMGLTAQNALTSEEENDIEKNAMQEEREKFVAFIDSITADDLKAVRPLPYRRRLKEQEKEPIRAALLKKWNYDGEYWDPIVENSPHPVVFIVTGNLTESDYEKIIEFIKVNAKSNIFEITEDGAFSEIEFSLFHPNCYETVYVDNSYEWIIYGSHESTITFGGAALIKFIAKLFADRAHLLNKW